MKNSLRVCFQSLPPKGVAGELFTAASDALAEANSAMRKHPDFPSAHHGHSVILEELEELWEEIKKQSPNRDALRKEAIQIAAVAIRFAAHICPTE